jgi:hypothetical protein
MTATSAFERLRPIVFGCSLILACVAVLGNALVATAQNDGTGFAPGNLVISRSVYNNNPNNIKVGQLLPPNCQNTTAGCAGNAINDGTYPYVWNNNTIDGSFGITSRLLLDQYTTGGTFINTLEMPNSLQPIAPQKGVPYSIDQLVTSFSSKSEIALNLSTDGTKLTFMGYVSPADNIDVSNSNTPGVIDLTNPVGIENYRAVADVDAQWNMHFTITNAYSGNNGRAAILNNSNGANYFYTAGNAGNGGNPQPDGVIIGAGAQFITPSTLPEAQQHPPIPSDPLASFNITQLGDKPDKIGKDTNFRGLTIFNNVVYFTKGSGGNGVNTVYWVDPTLQTCNDANGVGLPPANAQLPTAPMMYDPALVQTKGLDPNNMCILKGFPTALKSKTSFPFGVWFANATTLYVTDEGNGDNTYSNGMYTVAAGQTTAGLQKWIFDPVKQQWNLAYTLQAGLQLGVPYTVDGYPTGNNPVTNLPWSPGADGLRNVTGVVNTDGTATIYAVTSTVSGNGDQGADPNKVVVINDLISATSLPPNESFMVFKSAGFGEVLRGISFTPSTPGR